MENDYSDLEIQLKNSNRHADDAQRQSKTLTVELKDKQLKLDDAERNREDLTEQLQTSERRVGLQSAEVEELRAAVESAERARKQAETELLESNERATMLHVQNVALVNQKKKMETNLASFKVEAEDAMMSAIEAEEKAKQVLHIISVYSHVSHCAVFHKMRLFYYFNTRCQQCTLCSRGVN